MLINLKSLSPAVLVMISSMSVYLPATVFTLYEPITGKITSFQRWYPSLMPSFEENPRTQGYEILSRETRDL